MGLIRSAVKQVALAAVVLVGKRVAGIVAGKVKAKLSKKPLARG